MIRDDRAGLAHAGQELEPVKHWRAEGMGGAA